MSLIKCPECQKDISNTVKTCPHCGYSLRSVQELLCPECGHKVKESDTECKECGYPLNNHTMNNAIYNQLDKITGARSEKYVTFKDLFKNTFQHHTEEDLDDIFVSGSKETTPKIKDLNPKKVGAWVYVRILAVLLIIYAIMYVGFVNYHNSNFLPGLVFVGGFGVPITVLMFFFEINVFKNIPFYKVLKYFLIGGSASLILAILYFDIPFFAENATTSTVWGALLIGLIEEVAKAVIVAFFLFKSKKSNFILDGLLIGAAVGAGFAAFESAGYILRIGMQSNSIKEMIEVLKLRAVLAPGGHVAWAAIEGAALMYVKGFAKLDKKHLNDPRFLGVCLIPIILHGIWDMPFNVPYYLVQITLIVLAWIVVIYFINLGLKQVDDAKKAHQEE